MEDVVRKSNRERHQTDQFSPSKGWTKSELEQVGQRHRRLYPSRQCMRPDCVETRKELVELRAKMDEQTQRLRDEAAAINADFDESERLASEQLQQAMLELLNGEEEAQVRVTVGGNGRVRLNLVVRHPDDSTADVADACEELPPPPQAPRGSPRRHLRARRSAR